MLRYRKLFYLATMLLLLTHRVFLWLPPALAANLSNVSLVRALEIASSRFLSGEWGKCEVRVTLPDIASSSRLALGALAQLDCPAALRQIEDAKGRALTDVETLWLGYALEQSGRHTQALETWRSYPAIGRYFVVLAEHNAAGANAEAVERFTRLAVEVEPQDWSLQLERGRLLRSSNPTQAAVAFRRAIELAPEEAEGYRFLGLLRIEQSDFASAMEQCRKAVEVEPKNSLTWQCLGEAAFHAQDWEAAEWAFMTKLTLVPNDPEALFWLGRTYRYAGQNEQAAYWLAQAVQSTHDSGSWAAYAWYESGYTFMAQEQRAKAIQAFRRVQELAPDFVYIQVVQAELAHLEENR